MKLLRFGAPGQEQPGILDAAGNIRSLAGIIDDLAGDALSPPRSTNFACSTPARCR